MRDIKQLHPELQAIIPGFITDCEKAGLKVGIGECYRTVQEQNNLYAIGRTTGTKGAIVTNSVGTIYGSPHQWGVAFDFFCNIKGQEFDDSNGFFKKVGAIGKKHGLEWGGDWSGGWVDKPHLQLKKFFRDGTVSYLKRTYGTPANFMATWGKVATAVNTTCDTSGTFDIFQGDTYQVKITCSETPDFVSGNSNVCRCLLSRQTGNDYYYTVTAVGGVGEEAGLYLGDRRQCVARIISKLPVCDTTSPLTIRKGASYQFKVTAAKEPTFTAGTSGVLNISVAKKDRTAFYYKATAIGQPGAATGIYINGEKTTIVTVI